MKNKPEFYSLNMNKLIKDLKLEDADDKNIIKKNNRPFFVEVSVSQSFSAFIPLRSNLTHKNGFITENHERSKSGLDYSKSYLIKKENITEYKSQKETISSNEYNKIKRNLDKISEGYKKFLIKIENDIRNYDSLKVKDKRNIDFSSLQYQTESLKVCIQEINNLSELEVETEEIKKMKIEDISEKIKQDKTIKKKIIKKIQNKSMMK